MPNGNGGWLTATRRGLRRCCPRCGERGMFLGYLTAAEHCRRCGLEFETIRSDDVAPYFTILIVGHVVAPGVLISEQLASPPTWLELSIVLPATLLLTLALLPFVKGTVMGAIWASKQP